MNDTATLPAEIATFAADIRAHLNDLPDDDVADLTEGLEADLHDQAQDGDERFTLDDPAGYAEELRNAAGLPPCAAKGAARNVDYWQSVADRFRADIEPIRSHRAVRWTTNLLASLAPVWWVFRGWVMFQFLAVTFIGMSKVLPQNFGMFLLLVATCVLSAQWGRGLWSPNKLVAVVRHLVTIGVLCATIPLIVWIANELAPVATTSAQPARVVYYDDPGLYLDGEPVSNIFAFDSDGQEIRDVRLFDQDGDPLALVGGSWETQSSSTLDGQSGWDLVPYDTSAPGNGWNVYPLDEAKRSSDNTVDPTVRRPAQLPFATIAPLSQTVAPDPAGSPAPDPAVTPTTAPTP